MVPTTQVINLLKSSYCLISLYKTTQNIHTVVEILNSYLETLCRVYVYRIVTYRIGKVCIEYEICFLNIINTCYSDKNIFTK